MFLILADPISVRTIFETVYIVAALVPFLATNPEISTVARGTIIKISIFPKAYSLSFFESRNVLSKSLADQNMRAMGELLM